MRPTILLVDDDDAFKLLVEAAITKGRVDVSLQYVCDGEQAIAYLSRQDPFKDEAAFPFPSLVLLDLKMHRMNGFDVLRWKSERHELRETPFVILSSSNLERDKTAALELGARHYLVKPMEFLELIEMVQSLDKFWNRDTRKATAIKTAVHNQK